MPDWYKIPENNKLRPFNFIIGGYGIGKTYSAIERAICSFPGAFLYLRNTREQLQESCCAFGNPFKKWNNNNGREIILKMEKSHAVAYDQENGNLMGYGANLSTFENLRGVDLSDVKYIIFDEFIENKTFQFDQFKAFVRMYETVNRNRELEGFVPVKVVLLSNAQRMGNPILRGYNLIPIIENMQKNNQRILITNDGQKRIELPFSKVSDEKKNTALYKATEGALFQREALNNNFINDSFTGVKKVNINEYTPMVCIDDIYIYKHKSEVLYYACAIPAKVQTFKSIDNFLIFYRIYGVQLKLAIGSEKMYFSDYATKVDLLTLLKMIY